MVEVPLGFEVVVGTKMREDKDAKAEGQPPFYWQMMEQGF